MRGDGLIYHCTRPNCGWRAIITGHFGRYKVEEMVGNEIVVVVNVREKLWFLWRAANVAESWEDAHIMTNHNRNRSPQPRAVHREH